MKSKNANRLEMNHVQWKMNRSFKKLEDVEECGVAEFLGVVNKLWGEAISATKTAEGSRPITSEEMKQVFVTMIERNRNAFEWVCFLYQRRVFTQAIRCVDSLAFVQNKQAPPPVPDVIYNESKMHSAEMIERFMLELIQTIKQELDHALLVQLLANDATHIKRAGQLTSHLYSLIATMAECFFRTELSRVRHIAVRARMEQWGKG